ncbi:MAG: ATP-binding protein [Bacteroidota bacterium]
MKVSKFEKVLLSETLMKDILNRNKRLFLRSLWMIRLRWLAIIAVIPSTIIYKYLYHIQLSDFPIYIVCFFLIAENLISLKFLKRIETNGESFPDNQLTSKKVKSDFILIKNVLNFQIFIDLIALTFILYFTGGIENPFIFFYFFHLAIASVLLSQKETFIHTIIAVLLFLTLAYSTYLELVPYHVLYNYENYVDFMLYKNSFYVIKSTVSFIATVLILVFLASSIGKKLQNQEEKYADAIDKLKKHDTIKNEYVLRVTHDVKGHLAAIQSNLSVLTSRILGPLDDKHEGFIERAYKRTFIATHFIRDLLKLTKLRMSGPIKASKFDLRKALVNAANDVKTNAESKSITIESQIDDTVNEFYGDEFSIQEITSNLLLNAIKYTPEKGSITLVAQALKDTMQISIEDTGFGIPENEIEHIFEEFYRASNVKKIVLDGTGIGLTIVKKVVEQHGGKIWVESKLNEGSKFIFTLLKKG